MAKKSERPREAESEAAAAAPKARKSRAKAKEPSAGEAKPAKAAKPSKAKVAVKIATKAAAKPKAAVKARAKVKIKSESGEELEIHVPVGEPFLHPGSDPVGDVTDGEGRFVAAAEAESSPAQSNAEMAAQRAETTDAAIDGTVDSAVKNTVKGQSPAASEAASGASRKTNNLDAGENELDSDERDGDEAGSDGAQPAREPAKLDRLQKILSQAGIASRRRAEELITEGRIQVNGQVVTQLGAKADPARDHIRVDGKLISGAERHRHFVLNKPKGFVTTVSDPEGRPTVMQFFAKMNERLYPVGRLDYQSEGLLLVTNDGDLANQLTRAASGVQKTYLVKVAGQPSEEQLELLRSGVAIDREGPGSGTVHTAPAEIRQVRRGDNPWFEVVLIEGRNRELRKMFSAIGHFVEKIRRVGYGPLVLDLEPGKFRELDPEELAALRLAAEGKLKPRRAQAAKRDAMALPTVSARPSGFRDKPARPGAAPREFRPQSREYKPQAREFKPRSGKFKPAAREARPFRDASARRDKPRWEPRSGDRPDRQDRPSRPFDARAGFDRPQKDRFQDRSRFGRDDADTRPRPRPEDRGSNFRPQQREAAPRPENAVRQPARPQGDQPHFKRPGFNRTEESPRRFDRPAGKSFDRPAGRSFDKPAGRSFDRPAGRGFDARPNRSFDKPAGKSFAKPPARSFDRGAARSFDKGPGKPFGDAPGKSPMKSFSKPPERSFESKRPRLEIEPVQGFDKPAAKTWTKPADKSWSPKPAAGRDRDSSSRPPRPEGSAPAFRAQSGPRDGGTSRPAPGARSRPAFGARTGGSRPSSGSSSRPGSGSGSKPSFKSGSRPGSRPGTRSAGPKSGSRPSGSRAGQRPGSRPGPKSGPRPAFKRSGPAAGGKRRPGGSSRG
ncbi:MAG TPA: pseudouridine synthase [Terracidiphilus sp.]|jgi:23S rRNA pseudouridine2605 synthase|nr:pseudouridine synthase [Terracidiphilus sp.]